MPNVIARGAALIGFACALLCGCATQPVAHKDPRDPWEATNRKIFAFDMKLARKVAIPVGHAYQRVVPQVVRAGVGNFYDNMVYPITFVNDLLQGKFKPFLTDTGRFLMNSTVGLGGLFDPASRTGVLPKNDNDFGVTLGTWGAGPGPYLVLPFVGPSDVRDTAGRVPDWFMSPTWYIDTLWVWLSLDAGYTIDLDSRTLIPAYDLLESQHPFDEYAFARNAYLQQREFKIHGQSAKSQEQQELELEKSLEDDSGDSGTNGSGTNGSGTKGGGASKPSSPPPPPAPPSPSSGPKQ